MKPGITIYAENGKPIHIPPQCETEEEWWEMHGNKLCKDLDLLRVKREKQNAAA